MRSTFAGLVSVVSPALTGSLLGCSARTRPNLEHGVFHQLLANSVHQFGARQLEQFDGLLQLGRHHQLLAELQLLFYLNRHTASSESFRNIIVTPGVALGKDDATKLVHSLLTSRESALRVPLAQKRRLLAKPPSGGGDKALNYLALPWLATAFMAASMAAWSPR